VCRKAFGIIHIKKQSELHALQPPANKHTKMSLIIQHLSQFRMETLSIIDVFTSDRDTKSLFDLDLFKKVCQSLWFLPVLSILSGLSPSVKIIAQSHTSRMPDNPIAHDIDTLLLWPAVADERGLVSIHVFEAPFAAVTDASLYKVDWELVQRTYFNAVSHSLLWSLALSLGLYFYLIPFDTSDTSSSRNKI
jgi:hypothetical protein